MNNDFISKNSTGMASIFIAKVTVDINFTYSQIA